MTPKKGVAFDFDLSLVDSANRPQFKASPTIANGDFQISKDGGAFANLATLPVVSPLGSVNVLISLSATEMNADRIVVTAIDAAGSEWDNAVITITTDLVNEIADGFLDRNMATGTDSGTETVRTPRQAFRILRNKVEVNLGRVYKENDTTVSWTFAKTTDAAAQPIIEVDPTG